MGTSVAVCDELSYETAAGTVEPPDRVSEKLELVTVVGSTGWSKDALKAAAGLTPDAPAAGKVAVTPGGCGWCVVNDHVVAAPIGVPSAALMLVDSEAVYTVPYVRAADGVSVAVRVDGS